MGKAIRSLALAAAVAGLATPAAVRAEGGRHISVAPAATLLVPYFEVALPKKPTGKQKGVNTILTIQSATASAILAHVTIWSDLAVPVMFFDVYLTGYDSETIDLFEVIHGRLPRTASVGQDLGEPEISPQGPASQDINFASCTGTLPPEPLPADSVDHLRAALTGQPSALFGNQCFGRDYDEKKAIARGFVTVDTVVACSFLHPGNPGYLGPGGIASNLNWITGEWYIVNKKSIYGDNAVSVRADPAEFSAGDYTFYGRLVADSAADARQPLATVWEGRYANDRKDRFFPGGTEVIAWRDVKAPQNPFACGTLPPFFPMIQEEIVAFDDQEQVEQLQQPAVPPLPAAPVEPFPGATQKTAVGSTHLPVTFPRGFLRMNLNTAVVGQVINAGDPAAAQSFVTMVHSNRRHPMAVRGTALDDANNAQHGLALP